MTEQNNPPADGTESAAPAEQAKVALVPQDIGQKPDTQTPEQQADSDQGAERKRSKGGFQRKIEKKDQEIEFWKAEALKNKSNGHSEPRREEAKPQDAAPKLEDFDSYDDYIRADARFAAKQEAKEAFEQRDKTQREQSLREARDKQLGTHRERMQKYAEEHPDFEALVEESESPFTEAMRDACVESDRGPEIIDYLARNPEKAQAMTTMGITALNREIGKIEASLEKQADSTTTQNPPKASTKAPAPFKPVNAGSSKDGTTYRKDMSQSEYEAMRKRQIAAKGGGGRN